MFDFNARCANMRKMRTSLLDPPSGDISERLAAFLASRGTCGIGALLLFCFAIAICSYVQSPTLKSLFRSANLALMAVISLGVMRFSSFLMNSKWSFPFSFFFSF